MLLPLPDMGRPRIPILLAVVVLLAGGGVRAESTVVRDTRLENLGATPALGRGYTPAISALHSICFDKMPVTTASYDFDYSFEELETTVTGRSSVRHLSLRTHEVDEFVREQTRETTVTEGFVKQHIHYLLAVLSVESYYASIDEAQSELSKHALELLTEGDVHGFFTGCGTHYIRSMSRRSFFLTMFSYTSTDKTRDRVFERELEQQVRRFHGSSGPTAEDQEHEKKFSDRARSRSLKVVTRSIGLPSRATADMLPFDLATYKKAVKEAFRASQEPSSGRVVAMEIMPWLSNVLVLVTLDLSKAGIDKSEWIERKRILADNSEFYIELAAALQELNTQVHRAEACRRELDQDVMDGDKIDARYAKANVISHRTGARRPLKDLVEAVSDASIDNIRATGLRWRNGADGTSGAAACLSELERTSLSGRYHNDIPSCAWQRVRLPHVSTIDEFCPPNVEM